jgi:hypothetical protein
VTALIDLNGIAWIWAIIDVQKRRHSLSLSRPAYATAVPHALSRLIMVGEHNARRLQAHF